MDQYTKPIQGIKQRNHDQQLLLLQSVKGDNYKGRNREQLIINIYNILYLKIELFSSHINV